MFKKSPSTPCNALLNAMELTDPNSMKNNTQTKLRCPYTRHEDAQGTQRYSFITP